MGKEAGIHRDMIFELMYQEYSIPWLSQAIYRDDISIQATFNVNIESDVSDVGECEFYGFDFSNIKLSCGSTQNRVIQGSALTLVVNSPDPLTP